MSKKIITKIKNLFSFIKIDFSFILIFFIAICLREVYLYFCFICFVLLHELAHFFMAKKLGYLAKNIRLSFFGATLEGLDDFTLKDEIKVILIGPLFNLFVVVLCYLSFWFYPESYNYLYEILIANLSILVFNFLPIYPLDFGRIILALLTRKHLRVKALRVTKIISFLIIFSLFIVYLISFFFEFNFTLGFVCVNLMSLLLSSSNGTSFKRELFIFHKAKLIEKGLVERNIYLNKDISHYKLFKYIDDYHFVNFIFLDERYEISNTLTEIEFYKEIGFM